MPFPTAAWDPVVEKAGYCNANAAMVYGACDGYFGAACPDVPGEYTNFAHDNTAIAHELAHNITPRSVIKQIKEMIDGVVSDKTAKEDLKRAEAAAEFEAMSEKDLGKRIKLLEKQMLEHARNLEFEKAARVRDQLALLREQAFGAPGHDSNIVPIAPRGA